ncbi:MAG: hypothetical protein Q9212_005744 [Teloschistes hypoglaucus]
MEVIGGLSGVVAIVAAAAKVAKNLNEVRESYNAVALNIQLAAIQLSTIRTALEDIAEWRLNSKNDSNASRNLDATLADSLKGCAVLITVIDSKLGEAGFTPGVKHKIKHLWLEDVLKGYMSNLDGQVRALQLLLTSFQCRTVAEQMQRLEQREARTVFEQVRADTESLTIANRDIGDAASVLSFDPSVNFEMDDILMRHPAYQAAYGHWRPPVPRRLSQARPLSIPSSPPKAEAQVLVPQDNSLATIVDTSQTTGHPVHSLIPGASGQAAQGAEQPREAGKAFDADVRPFSMLSAIPPPLTFASRPKKEEATTEENGSVSSAVETFKDQLQSAFEAPAVQAGSQIVAVQEKDSRSDEEGSDLDEMVTLLPLASHFDISRKPETRDRTLHKLSVSSRDDDGHTITSRESRSVNSTHDGIPLPRSSRGADLPEAERDDEGITYVNESQAVFITPSSHTRTSGMGSGDPGSRSLKRQPSTDSDLYASSITGKTAAAPETMQRSPSSRSALYASSIAAEKGGVLADNDDQETIHPAFRKQPPSVDHVPDEVVMRDFVKASPSLEDTGPEETAGNAMGKATPQTAPAALDTGIHTSPKIIDTTEDNDSQTIQPRSAPIPAQASRSPKHHSFSTNNVPEREGPDSDSARRANSEQHGLKIILTPEVDAKNIPNSNSEIMAPPARPPPPPPKPSSTAKPITTLSPTASLDTGRRWSAESSVPRHMMTGALTASPIERDESINETLSTVSSSDRSDRQTASSEMNSSSNTIETSLASAPAHPPGTLRGQAQNDLHKLQLELTAAKSRGDTTAQKASLQQSMDVIRKAYLSTSAAQSTDPMSKVGSPSKPKSSRLSLMPKKSLLSMVGKKSKQMDLHEAARIGDMDTLRSLLEDRVNINARGERFITPQMEAARRSHLHILETLKEFGADEFAVDGAGRNVLHMAVMANQAKAVSWLIEAYPPAAHDVPGRKSSRLAWATEAVMGSRTSKILREASDGEGSRPLHLAAKLGLPAMTSLLLDHGSDIEARDNWGRHSLIVAAMINRLNIVEVLLQRGADIKAQDVDGLSALHWAAQNNHYDVARLLLTGGTSSFQSNKWVHEHYDKNGDLPIHAAARKGHRDVVSLLKGDRETSELPTKHGESLMHLAALEGHLELAREFLSDNADVNVWAKPHSYHIRISSENDKGYSPKSLPLPYNIIPLHYSCTRGYFEMTELLLENGAWVNAAPDDDNHGKSPLMMAVESGSTNLVCLLLARGAKVNAAVQATLMTALHMAAHRGDLETTQELVRYGAKTAARTRDLRTPEELISKIKDSKKRAAMETYFGELTRARYAKIKAQMAENRQAAGGSLQPRPTPSPAAVVPYQQPMRTTAGSMYAPEYLDPENDAFPEAPPAYTPGNHVPRNLVNRQGVYRPQYGSSVDLNKYDPNDMGWMDGRPDAANADTKVQKGFGKAAALGSALITLSLWAATSFAAPPHLGLKFEKRAGQLPTLSLPYATYRAASYNPNGDIYVFKNIRFAAPPVGNLRWAKPALPTPESSIQDGSYGPICVQAPIKGPQLSGPGASSPIGQALNQFLAGIPIPSFKAASEDCLFLDVYVPAKAVENPSLRLPVISWFYGGAYVFGAKDQFDPVLPLYRGTGVIQESGGNVIFVASNYRVGAYGFLAGNTMEKEGLPNAGLYDQHAALQWIQDYIHLLGGDKTKVSAWGESAGAGSILHQLVAFGGTQDPLFSKAVLQSAAFQPLFDRKGMLESTFRNFTALAGCAGQGVACLRAASADTLDKANTALNTRGTPSTFAVGPSTDGNLIRQLPALEFASGIVTSLFQLALLTRHYTKLPTSFIFSHVSDEAELFVPPNVQTDAQFNAYIAAAFPPYSQTSGINGIIEARYPPVMSGTSTPSNYSSERERLKAVQQEANFVCYVRYLSDAYPNKHYNLQYSVTPALHATDLLPTFYNLNLDLDVLGQDVPFPLIPGFGSFAQAYQSYLTSHA